MMTFALALCLGCPPGGCKSGPLFIPAPVVIQQAMPKTAIGSAVAFRAAPVRTVTKTVTRSAFRPLRTVGYVLTPWRW